MKHISIHLLETERLRLRKLTVNDAEDYSYVWSDKEHIIWEPPFSDEQTASLEKRIREFDRPDGYCWGIVEKISGKVVGEIFTVNNSDKTQSCEIAYGMALNYRNKGYMTEALRCVLHFLLLDVGYNRVQAGHLADTPASGRVMEKAGMVYEVTLRQDNINRKGILSDSKIYSMLKKDILTD